MTNNIQYYCVGFTWRGSDPENQLSRFIENGIWENGFDDKYAQRVNAVVKGSRIAAKTTYTRKEERETISILEIYATGTVTENPNDGQTLQVNWDENFEPFIIKNKGAYRSTISRIKNLETVQEIFKDDKNIIEDNGLKFYSGTEFRENHHLYPCFVFRKDDWDDFGYKTQYEIEYYTADKESVVIGKAKFFNKTDSSGDLPRYFSSLGNNYCSLGQSNSYYSNLAKRLDKDTAELYLDAVNDLAINKGLIDEFENEYGFKNSILRSSEAQKALREGLRTYKGQTIDNTIKFTFSTQIGSATSPHSIKFDFSEKPNIPYRVKVLIGKNGTGKTQYIAKLAATLSGYEEQGEFSTKYLPQFSRVIAVSYSLFDRFPRPKQTKTYSYYYCGFQGGKGFLTDNQINSRLKKAFAILEKSDRIPFFSRYLSMVLSDDIVQDILGEDDISLSAKEFTLYDENEFSRYSSGQVVMILMLAEVLAYITNESLLIFDEPETHLHPNSISQFISVINKILTNYNSFAIVSTHSPQIVQEVPAKDIVIIDRIQNTPSARGISIETFGENLNTITERIFQTASHDEYYREFLAKLSEKLDYDKIVALFAKNSLPLGLNAKIYLQSLDES